MPRGWGPYLVVLYLPEYGHQEFIVEARDEYNGKPIEATPDCRGSAEWNATEAAWVIAKAKFGVEPGWHTGNCHATTRRL